MYTWRAGHPSSLLLLHAVPSSSFKLLNPTQTSLRTAIILINSEQRKGRAPEEQAELACSAACTAAPLHSCTSQVSGTSVAEPWPSAREAPL